MDIIIPDGYFDIPEECIVKKDDQVANVTKKYEEKNGALNVYLPSVIWMKVDDAEIGKEKKFSGKVVIRKI